MSNFLKYFIPPVAKVEEEQRVIKEENSALSSIAKSISSAISPVLASTVELKNRVTTAIPSLVNSKAEAVIKSAFSKFPSLRLYAEFLYNWPSLGLDVKTILAIMLAIIKRESVPPFNESSKGTGVRGFMSHRKTNWIHNTSKFLSTTAGRSPMLRRFLTEAEQALGLPRNIMLNAEAYYDDFVYPSLQLLPMIGQTIDLINNTNELFRYDSSKGWVLAPGLKKRPTFTKWSELVGADLKQYQLGLAQIMTGIHINGRGLVFGNGSPAHTDRIALVRQDLPTTLAFVNSSFADNMFKDPLTSLAIWGGTDSPTLTGDPHRRRDLNYAYDVIYAPSQGNLIVKDSRSCILDLYDIDVDDSIYNKTTIEFATREPHNLSSRNISTGQIVYTSPLNKAACVYAWMDGQLMFAGDQNINHNSYIAHQKMTQLRNILGQALLRSI